MGPPARGRPQPPQHPAAGDEGPLAQCHHSLPRAGAPAGKPSRASPRSPSARRARWGWGNGAPGSRSSPTSPACPHPPQEPTKRLCPPTAVPRREAASGPAPPQLLLRGGAGGLGPGPAACRRCAAMASLLPRRAAAAAADCRRRRLLLPPPAPGPAAARRGSSALPAALVRRGGLVGGRWVETPAVFPVQDPASGEELARVADCGAAEARAAVRAAHEAGAAWSRLPAKVRGRGRWCSAGRRGDPGPGGDAAPGAAWGGEVGSGEGSPAPGWAVSPTPGVFWGSASPRGRSASRWSGRPPRRPSLFPGEERAAAAVVRADAGEQGRAGEDHNGRERE